MEDTIEQSSVFKCRSCQEIVDTVDFLPCSHLVCSACRQNRMNDGGCLSGATRGCIKQHLNSNFWKTRLANLTRLLDETETKLSVLESQKIIYVDDHEIRKEQFIAKQEAALNKFIQQQQAERESTFFHYDRVLKKNLNTNERSLLDLTVQVKNLEADVDSMSNNVEFLILMNEGKLSSDEAAKFQNYLASVCPKEINVKPFMYEPGIIYSVGNTIWTSDGNRLTKKVDGSIVTKIEVGRNPDSKSRHKIIFVDNDIFALECDGDVFTFNHADLSNQVTMPLSKFKDAYRIKSEGPTIIVNFRNKELQFETGYLWDTLSFAYVENTLMIYDSTHCFSIPMNQLI